MQLHRWIMLLTQEKDREEMNDQLENAGLEADVNMLHCYFAANAFVQCRKNMKEWHRKENDQMTCWGHLAFVCCFTARIHCECCKGEGVGKRLLESPLS